MSLIRQLWLLLLITVLVALLGSALVNVDAARSYLQTELRLKNSDNAQALALTLSQQHGDPALLELVLSAQFDTGFYDRIVLTGTDGRVLIERSAGPAPVEAPDWFTRLTPIDAPAGLAQVSDGWRPIGTLELTSATGFAYRHLWLGSVRSAGWLLLVGAVAAGLGTLVLRRIRAPLDATVAQAEALVDRRFVTVDEPAVPELRQLSRAMNAMVQRLRAIFGQQDAQLEALRQQAQADAVTGLANRAHFMARLDALRVRDDAPPVAALLLVRVRALAALNREMGHAEVDALLKALADALRTAAPGDDALLGRLNGSDFALFLPAADVAEAAAQTMETLRLALARWPATSVALGGVAWAPGDTLAASMQAADAALARAEAQPGFAASFNEVPLETPDPPRGEAEWRSSLLAAVQMRSAALGAYPVVDRHGALLHLESPLRLQLGVVGPLEPAARWLPWALRCGLSAQADALAVALALELIERDGQPRGVNLAPDSLLDSGFVAALRTLLLAHPQAAQKLWMEVGEQAALGLPLALLRELGQQLRPLGVKLGIEHAGERLVRLGRLYEAGLDYVKLDAALSLGMAEDPSRATFVRSLVGTLHALGMQVHAEGVRDERDARALWACDVDGITGPWVTAIQR